MSYQSCKPFAQFAPGFHCRGICERPHDLITKSPRYKGQTAQELGIKSCKRCSVHWKPETGTYCPCCNQRLRTRIRSKQSRAYRERQREQAASIATST